MQNRVIIYDPKVSRLSVQRLSLSDTEVWPEELIACRGILRAGPKRLYAISVLRGTISRVHTLREKARKKREYNDCSVSG